MVAGYQERRVQYKTRMSKGDFRKRRDIPGNIQDHWAMESGRGLLAIRCAVFQLS